MNTTGRPCDSASLRELQQVEGPFHVDLMGGHRREFGASTTAPPVKDQFHLELGEHSLEHTSIQN
jgi:hypothetical protein